MTAWRTLSAWALRDQLRRPGPALLTAAAVFSLVVVATVPLLLAQAFSATAARVLDAGPDLVVRRVGAGGWMPMPASPAVAAAAEVPGVVSVRPRIWGVVRCGDTPLTVMALPEQGRGDRSPGLPAAPRPGQAVAGSVAARAAADGVLQLSGAVRRPLRVAAVLDPAADLAAADVVFVHPADARALLDLPEAFVSDLALTVFHEEEAQALLAELADAFPWTVGITTRRETVERYAAGFARRGGIVSLAAVPALLALLLLVLAAALPSGNGRAEAALLKAMGWRSADVVVFQAAGRATLAAAAAAAGALTSWWLVFSRGVRWPAELFFDWPGEAPLLALQSTGAVWTAVQVLAFVLAPYLGALLWPALQNARTPAGRIAGGDWTL